LTREKISRTARSRIALGSARCDAIDDEIDRVSIRNSVTDSGVREKKFARNIA
jgi:hypothetical protein